MRMVGHVVYGYELLLLAGNYPCNVFLKLIVVLGSNDVLSAFHGKDDLNINLSVGVRHHGTISLLNGAKKFYFVARYYRDATPNGVGCTKQFENLQRCDR